jgi:hypothetical protein
MKHSQKKEVRNKVDKLLYQYKKYHEASDKSEKDLIGDKMTYADPVVWMMYKHEAYLGSDREIATVGTLRHHCEDHGGICAKRFKFLSAYIKGKHGKDILSSQEFPNDTRIELLYGSKLLDNVVSDLDFIEEWAKYEFYKKDGQVKKWQNYHVVQNT